MPIDYLIEDRLTTGGVALFVGEPKVGKTTMVRDLAVCVAKGRSWLGHACKQGPVWYLALEDQKSEMLRHFRRLGCTDQDPLFLMCGRTPEGIMGVLREWAATRERPVLIIIDTIQRFLRLRDVKDYAEVTNRLDPLIHLARDLQAAIWLNHHAGKAEKGDLDNALGSTAFAGSADTIVLIKKIGLQRVMWTEQRIGPSLLEPVVIEVDAVGHVRLGPTLAAAEHGRIEDAMLAVVRAADGPCTEQQINVAVEGQNRLKVAALRNLLSRGLVSRAGAGRRNSPYLYSPSPDVDSGSAVRVREGNDRTGNENDADPLGNHEPDSASPPERSTEPGPGWSNDENEQSDPGHGPHIENHGEPATDNRIGDDSVDERQCDWDAIFADERERTAVPHDEDDDVIPE
jgi:hypothetical protein